MTAVIVTATTVIPLVFDLQRHHLDSRHLTKSPVPFTTSSFSKPFGSIFGWASPPVQTPYSVPILLSNILLIMSLLLLSLLLLLF